MYIEVYISNERLEMNKVFLAILILFTISEFCSGQTPQAKSFIFDGYVMTPDSRITSYNVCYTKLLRDPG